MLTSAVSVAFRDPTCENVSGLPSRTGATLSVLNDPAGPVVDPKLFVATRHAEYCVLGVRLLTSAWTGPLVPGSAGVASPLVQLGPAAYWK